MSRANWTSFGSAIRAASWSLILSESAPIVSLMPPLGSQPSPGSYSVNESTIFRIAPCIPYFPRLLRQLKRSVEVAGLCQCLRNIAQGAFSFSRSGNSVASRRDCSITLRASAVSPAL